MKQILKKFENFNEELTDYNAMLYNTIVKEDIIDIIDMFLEDLEAYNKENNIIMVRGEIQKAINLFKKFYSVKDTYYSEKERYEEMTLGDDGQNDDFFKDIISKI